MREVSHADSVIIDIRNLRARTAPGDSRSYVELVSTAFIEQERVIVTRTVLSAKEAREAAAAMVRAADILESTPGVTHA